MELFQQAQAALRNYFGYDQFRPLQGEAIEAVLQQKDVVVLMPTGGGKSLCFQIPAITLPGLCVVVSPLIALMKDQVEALRANGIEAAYLNSLQSDEEQKFIVQQAYNGTLSLLYVSPEKLLSEHFDQFLVQLNINLFAIDEAHCISAWGHDFRPEYTQLTFLKRQFPQVPLMALTATADPLTRQDIVQQLDLEDPLVLMRSFDRPNLSLEVVPGQDRYKKIRRFVLDRKDQSGIIYTLSRKNAEKIAEKLRADGVVAGHYHAGMPAAERAKAQEDFVHDRIPVVCATIAFGMGIDKSNVRWVIHYNLPKNIESYYQEIGRAGRDGLPAQTMLFYTFSDVMQWQRFMEEGSSRELEQEKLLRMQEYAEAHICRRKILLAYFGEQQLTNCGNCDVCRNPPAFVDGTVVAQQALSAVYRLKSAEPMGTVINLLRGSAQRDIIEKGYQHLKTYGAGKLIAYRHWQQYLLQLLQMGYLKVAYDQHNAVQLTEASRRVLFEGEKVEMVDQHALETQRKTKEKQKKAEPTEQDPDLFDDLRILRRELAADRSVPAYIVFSDATLKDMARIKPTNLEEMETVSGVGQKKLEQYGTVFLQRIANFVKA